MLFTGGHFESAPTSPPSLLKMYYHSCWLAVVFKYVQLHYCFQHLFLEIDTLVS